MRLSIQIFDEYLLMFFGCFFGLFIISFGISLSPYFIIETRRSREEEFVTLISFPKYKPRGE